MSNSRPFLDTLRDLRGGNVHDELSDALQEVVAAVSAEGKAGKLTLTISVKPAGAGQGALLVVDDIKIAVPKPTNGGTIFYATPDNNLQREDPKQSRLPLRDVGAGPEPREIGIPGSAARALA